MNTRTTSKAERNSSRKGGDAGDSGESGKSRSFEIRSGAVDQYGRHWVEVTDGRNNCWLQTIDLAGGGSAALSILDKAGIVLLSPRSLRELANAAEGWHEFRKVSILDRPGWWGSSFLHGSGKLISSAGKEAPIVSLLPIEKYSCKGSVKDWLSAFTPLLVGQDALLVALGLAYLPPLIGILRETDLAISNPIFEWCGRSSTGKTTGGVKLPGSVWGYKDDGVLGFGESWFATTSGIVELLDVHRGSLLCLDEAQLAHDNKQQRAETVKRVIHVIEKGMAKTTQNTGPIASAADLVCVSTSNDPLETYLRDSPEAVESVFARMITFRIPSTSRHGILKVLPKGFQSSGAAIDAINGAITQYHGVPAVRFLKRLVAELESNRAGLINRIRKLRDKMLMAMGIEPGDGVAYRRAKPYALAYAATALARCYGVLPTKREVGSYRDAFIEVWAWTKHDTEKDSRQRPTPREAIHDYFTRHQGIFLRSSPDRPMSRKEFKNCAGFVHKKRSGETELLLSPWKFSRHFGFTRDELAELNNNRILVGEGGKKPRNDNKRCVRSNLKGKKVKDRVFVIRIDRL